MNSHFRAIGLGVLATVLCLAGSNAAPSRAQDTPVEAPSYAAQLRYIGRDGATGLPSRVDDRFIAEVEEDYANYGKVETEAIPPPPPGPVDLVRLELPSIAVDAAVERFGVDKFGRLDVPQDAITVGWHPGYTHLPGEQASTFLAAHFVYGNTPGVFSALNTLSPGDAVVIGTSAAKATYQVQSVAEYPLSSIDMGAILHGLEGAESVVLMTCSGPSDEGEFAFRTVVIASRVS